MTFRFPFAQSISRQARGRDRSRGALLVLSPSPIRQPRREGLTVFTRSHTTRKSARFRVEPCCPRAATPIRAITARHSLFPSSFTRRSFPRRAYPVPRLCRMDGLGSSHMPGVHHPRWETRTFPNLTPRLLATACQNLWLFIVDDKAELHLSIYHTIRT